MIKRTIAILALGCALASATVIRAAGPENAKLVVVLYPEANNGSPGSVLADHGIRSTFTSSYKGAIEIQNEYLDLSRFPDADYQRDLAKFLRRKYAGRKVDLAIAGLASGLDYALKYRDDIIPNEPIVFMAVDQREIQARTLPADVIGVPIQMDITTSLDVALTALPETRQVYVVVGKAKFDNYWEAESRAKFNQYADKLELVYLAGLPMSDLLEKVASLPDHSLIYYLHIFEDGSGKVYMPAEALELIAAKANAPIFSHVDSYLGRGTVGGRVFSFEAAGKQAAEIGIRILAGEKPEVIGVQPPGDNAYLFDWRQLKRWGIREANLPPGSIVRYKELTMWDQYKWRLIGAISVTVLQGLLITGLIVQGYRRQRAERRFRQAVDAAPTGMVIIGQNGEVVLANPQMERLFGYNANEMVGQPTENFVPARYRSEHLNFLRRFSESPQSRPMGTGQELVGRRKDGSEFPIEVGLNPLRTEHGVAVLASVIDITARREAEQDLRQSQATLRELTGKLLGAQETERRRIARELHDDLGQSLALLSVELDLLQQRPPQDATQLTERVAKLSSRVKQLSSSIHDLSHQLHPMKLEQLGLVAAIRGLCQELGESHDLVIGFLYDAPAESIPPEIALCLYRIAQEALQNIIKHSGAQHVTVELRPTGEEICLRVRDDGIGFDPSTVTKQGGLGLASMRERMRLVNGQITVHGDAQHGTQIEARVPLGIGGALAVESQDGFAVA